MSDEINYIDPAEFVDVGFLQEVNRRFLHPLGLALEVDPGAEAGEYCARIWDYRHDSEGIAFNEPCDPDKLRRVQAELERHDQHRTDQWGWVVQPVDVGIGREPTGETDAGPSR